MRGVYGGGFKQGIGAEEAHWDGGRTGVAGRLGINSPQVWRDVVTWLGVADALAMERVQFDDGVSRWRPLNDVIHLWPVSTEGLGSLASEPA